MNSIRPHQTRNGGMKECGCGWMESIQDWVYCAKHAEEVLELLKFKKLYHELLLAVGNVYPNETRHETALRYIKQAEQGSNQAKDAVAARWY